MKKTCVIGWPIKHSRSPLIHNHWLKTYAIEGLYERVAVEPKDLHSFIRNLAQDGYVGCNVTIPHKEAAPAAVDRYDASVAETGSLNTIYFDNGKICGTSTDGEGFLNNVRSTQPTTNISAGNVLLLGAGGSAKAICQRLLCENVGRIFVFNRTTARAEELVKLFGQKIVPVTTTQLENTLQKTDLLINTTSQGMIGQPPLHIDLSQLQPHATVADIVYVPLKTNLILQAEERGLKTVPGLGMLLHQAVAGFHHWYGTKPEVTQELYDLVAQDIMAETSK